MITGDYKRRLRAILSADVEGYSRLMGEDEDNTVHTLTAYRKIMSSSIEKHHGRVVDSPGDNLLAEFESVRDAVQCAVEIQKKLQIQNSELPENRKMRFRIGINLGDVITEGNRIYGDGVNVAARIESLAEAGGICLSRSAYDQVIGKIDIGYDCLGEHDVKNIERPIRVYKILMDSVPDHFNRDKKPYAPVTGKVDTSSIPDKLSIAVLPFENLSPDPDQEYFSDGLSEELINKLAQVRDLQVIARTSSFYFKGKDVDLPTIGEKLGVTYVLEGSVRKSGNWLRITAQLIKVTDGYHLFSKTYDRELKDIFAIQDEIAIAVTTALSVTLGVGEFNRLGMTRNIEAYDEILRANASCVKYTPESIIAAIDQAKHALDIDPGFGLGWLSLYEFYLYGINLLPPGQTIDFEARMVEALKRAQSIVPDLPEVIIFTAYSHQRSGKWLEADRLWKQILDERSHVDSGANRHYGEMLIAAGRSNDALTYLQRAKRLSPLDPTISVILSLSLFNSKRIDLAFAEARRGQTLDGSSMYFFVIEYLVALENNDRPRAAATINRYYGPESEYPNATMLRLSEILLMEDKSAALSELRELSKCSDNSPATKFSLAHVASVLGDAEFAFKMFLESRNDLISIASWHPIHRGIRQLAAFKTYIRDVGLYDYWRSTGEWPDLCRPVDDDDFVCE